MKGFASGSSCLLLNNKPVYLRVRAGGRIVDRPILLLFEKRSIFNKNKILPTSYSRLLVILDKRLLGEGRQRRLLIILLFMKKIKNNSLILCINKWKKSLEIVSGIDDDDDHYHHHHHLRCCRRCRRFKVVVAGAWATLATRATPSAAPDRFSPLAGATDGNVAQLRWGPFARSHRRCAR